MVILAIYLYMEWRRSKDWIRINKAILTDFEGRLFNGIVPSINWTHLWSDIHWLIPEGIFFSWDGFPGLFYGPIGVKGITLIRWHVRSIVIFIGRFPPIRCIFTHLPTIVVMMYVVCWINSCLYFITFWSIFLETLWCGVTI